MENEMNFLKEGEVRSLATYQGGACRSRMATEDGAFGHIQAMRHGTASRVDDHRLHDAILLCGIECLVAVVDEHRNLGMFGEDEVGGLGGVQDDVGRIHQEHLASQPGSGQLPLCRTCLINGNDVSQLFAHARQRGVLVDELLLSLMDVPGVGLGMMFHVVEKLIGHLDGLGDLVLDGETSNLMEKLTKAAVLVGHVHPTVDTVDGVEPRRHLGIGVEVTERLEGSAAVRVNRAAGGGPLFDGGGMMVNALNGQCTRRKPLLTNVLGHGDIQQPDVGSFHGLSGRPGVRLRGRNGEHLDVGFLEVAVRKVGSEPAVDAIAVEEDGRLDALGRHGNGRHGNGSVVISMGGHRVFNFFTENGARKKRRTSPYFVPVFIRQV